MHCKMPSERSGGDETSMGEESESDFDDLPGLTDGSESSEDDEAGDGQNITISENSGHGDEEQPPVSCFLHEFFK